MAKTPAIRLGFRPHAAGGGEHVVLRGADLDTAASSNATAHTGRAVIFPTFTPGSWEPVSCCFTVAIPTATM